MGEDIIKVRWSRHLWWLVPGLSVVGYPLGRLVVPPGASWALQLSGALLTFLTPAVGVAVLSSLDRAALSALLRRRAVFWAGMAVISPVLLVYLYLILWALGLFKLLYPTWRCLTTAVLLLSPILLRQGPLRERPVVPSPSIFRFLKAHRVSAVALLLFAALHLTSHLAAVWSIELNISVFRTFRIIYRNSLVEPLLLLAIVVQVVTGLFVFKAGSEARRTCFDRLQAYSGLYLALFLSIHTFAIAVLNRNTDFFIATGGNNVTLGIFFQYYTLAPLAFFTHLACALRRLRLRHHPTLTRERAAYSTLALGALVSLLIALAVAGVHVNNDRARFGTQHSRLAR